MRAGAFKYRVDDAEVRAVLEQLPKRIANNVRKRGMRKPLAKVRDGLRRLWRSAKFRGKAPHRKAIAAATRIDIRRGQRGIIRGIVGVQYGKKGGARAKGRQRVYHLLEGGFKHTTSRGKGLLGAIRSAVGIGNRVPGRGISARFARANAKRIYKEISQSILAEARTALKGAKA